MHGTTVSYEEFCSLKDWSYQQSVQLSQLQKGLGPYAHLIQSFLFQPEVSQDLMCCL